MIRRVDPVRLAWDTLCVTGIPVASGSARLHPDSAVVARAWGQAFPQEAGQWPESVTITAFSIEDLITTFH